MTPDSSSLARSRGRRPFVALLAVVAGACALPAPTSGGRAMPPYVPVQALLSGIPNRPELVAVIPFYQKPNETEQEQTKVIIPAVVGDAHGNGVAHGNFILDTGDPIVNLNRTFLQADSTGGVDSITTATRMPEPPDASQFVWVTLGLGTLVDRFTTPQGGGPDAALHPSNAVLDHAFGNFSWVFAPRLGNIGLSALEPFETIIDYPHRRVILVRLDSAGHRLVDVPAYQPVHIVPLVRIARTGGQVGLLARIGTQVDTLMIDTGDGIGDNEQERHAAITLQQALTAGQSIFNLDSADVSKIVTIPIPSPIRIIGYAFLRQLGVVGFNLRTRQLILYRPLR